MKLTYEIIKGGALKPGDLFLFEQQKRNYEKGINKDALAFTIGVRTEIPIPERLAEGNVYKITSMEVENVV